MPVSKNAVKHQPQSTSKRVPSGSDKARGTRYGTFEDWRDASNRCENSSRGHAGAIRDGR